MELARWCDSCFSGLHSQLPTGQVQRIREYLEIQTTLRFEISFLGLDYSSIVEGKR